MSSKPTGNGRPALDLPALDLPALDVTGPPGPDTAESAPPGARPAAPTAAPPPAGARDPVARPRRPLWPGLVPLAAGLAIVLVVLGLLVTSVAQTVALAVPVALVGAGLGWIGRSLHAPALRGIGIATIAVALAGPVLMAASPPNPLTRITVRAAVPPGAAEGTLRATLGNGQLRVGSGGPGLFEAELLSSGRPQSGVTTNGSSAVVDLRAPAQRGLLARNRGSDWNVALSTALPWRLELDADSITGDLDLQRLNLHGARVDAGLARLALRLGAPAARTRVDVRLTGGLVDIYLPRNAGIELRLHGPVSADLGGRDLRRAGGVWRSGGDPARTYAILVDSGPGRVRLHWS
ncbi:MAG TPA: hypothetical protein VKG45_03235 [Actinomycetes bacterium]|nr:hypothetical protein [Actinomycetes bacterium]